MTRCSSCQQRGPGYSLNCVIQTEAACPVQRAVLAGLSNTHSTKGLLSSRLAHAEPTQRDSNQKAGQLILQVQKAAVPPSQ